MFFLCACVMMGTAPGPCACEAITLPTELHPHPPAAEVENKKASAIRSQVATLPCEASGRNFQQGHLRNSPLRWEGPHQGGRETPTRSVWVLICSLGLIWAGEHPPEPRAQP